MSAPIRQHAFAAAMPPARAAQSLGLYGHIRANRARAAKLIGLFFIALQFGALGALALPLHLIAFSRPVAPFVDPVGYLTVVVPLVTLAGVILFAYLYVVHVRDARRAVDWVAVDRRTEPRLFRILEPLCIGVGMAVPRVGIAESPARNAFACGHGGRSDVLVLTRGLIDALDDDELAAVMAHELTHIRSGDVRLIAIITVLTKVVSLITSSDEGRTPVAGQMGALAFLAALGGARTRRNETVQKLQQLALLAIFPVFLLMIAAMGFIMQTAARAAHAARLSIGVSREFLADAGAVEMTQNPAALVSALRKIEGRSTLGRIAPEYDAMMIDGEAHGEEALHPTIAERVAALAKTMGAMVHVAVRGRDTRPGQPGDIPQRAFGRRGLAAAAAAPVSALSAEDHDAAHGRFVRAKLSDADGARAIARRSGEEVDILRAFWRVGPVNGRSVINTTPDQSRTLAIALCLTGLLYGGLLLAGVKPTSMVRALGAASAIGAIDQADRFDSRDAGRRIVSANDPAVARFLAFGDRPADRCVKTSWNGGGANADRVRGGDVPTLALEAATGAAFDVPMLAGADRDDALRQYVAFRAAGLGQTFALSGTDGVALAIAQMETPEHRAAVAALGQRLADPAFAATLPGHHGVAARLLASDPAAFVPCAMRHAASRPDGFADRAMDGWEARNGIIAPGSGDGATARSIFTERQDYRQPTVGLPAGAEGS